MSKVEYIVIEPSIVGNMSSGFETVYGWDGMRYPSAEAAIAAGFESRESDDFNIVALSGNRLVDFRWMDKPMNDPEGERAIAKQHGFKLRASRPPTDGGSGVMRWCLSHRADPAARELADRHYNRQKPGSKQFVPPGRCCVLLEETGRAFWVTSWPFAEYVKHDWAGAWVCSAFRSEDAGASTELIRQALAASRVFWGEVPALGCVTFIDPRHVEPIMTHGVPTFGRTWIKAGFKYVGKTKAGLLAYQILPRDMPPAAPAKPRSMYGDAPLFAKEAAE